MKIHSLENRQKEAFDRWRAARWTGRGNAKKLRKKYLNLLGISFEDYKQSLIQKP